MFIFFNDKSFLDTVKEIKYKKQNIAIEKNIEITVIKIRLLKLMFIKDWNGVNTDFKLIDIFYILLKENNKGRLMILKNIFIDCCFLFFHKCLKEHH